MIPKKMKDPGSCTIPCDVGNRHFSRALCDLRSRVSLIPLSLASFLDLLDDPRPVQMVLQLADKSLVKPNGVLENILV